jgi:hypothetical protein
MSEQMQWEYRIVSVSAWWGVNDQALEARLNELGQDGWEVVNALGSPNNTKVIVVAKRPLRAETRRRRSWPGQQPA